MNAKQEFTNNQIWVLTFRGAFQRAGIYSSDVSNTQKTQFKFKLRGFVENLVEAEYLKGAVSEQNHLHNIKEVQSYSQNFNSILINSELNFGVSQKILNLYLKHQWCLGRIPEPPHFPMDRIIQIKLGCNPIVNWTKMTDINQYNSVIKKAREEATKQGIKSLAELELKLYNH